MINKLSHISVLVLDQDRAKRFYTEKLGFEVHTDQTMGPFRWLTVCPKGQPDLQIVLMPLKPSPMLDEATVGTLRSLVEKGTFGAGVLETDDCRRTFEELKSRGVEFVSDVPEFPWGYVAQFQDPDGNRLQIREGR